MKFSKDSLRIDAGQVAEELAQSVQHQIRRQLKKAGAVVGISGGLDSSVVLALCAKALGPKRVLGVMMPERDSSPDSQELAQSLADLNSVVASKFTLIDATRILLRHGPQGGNLDDVKVLDTLIASTDMVAADAYATTLFGFKPEDIRSTVAAHEMGLGEMNLDKVKIVNV